MPTEARHCSHSPVTVVTVEAVVHQAPAAPTTLDAERLERELTAMLTRYLTNYWPKALCARREIS